MAQKDIVGGIFGITPELYQQGLARKTTADNLTAAQLTPGQLAGYYAMEAGSGLGRATQGLLGVEDPQMQLISRTNQLVQEIGVDTPEKLTTLAGELQKLPGGAALAAQALEERDKRLVSAATVKQKSRENLPTPQTQAEAAKLLSLQAKYPDTIEGRAKAADEFADWKSSYKQKEAAAGVPGPGEVKVSDLKGAKDIVDDYTKLPKTKLNAVGEIGIYLNQVQQNNPTALPQLNRSLVKLAGDSQIGQNEVKNILGSSGFTADVIDGVNKFFTGAPTNAKLEDVARGVKAIEKYYADQYEKGRETSKRVLSNARLDERTISDLIPSAYNTGSKTPVYAVNPQTKERIMSIDGGKTWTPVK